MGIFKKLITMPVIAGLFIMGLHCADPAVVLAASGSNAGITIHEPENEIIREVREVQKEEGWFSRYKWWLLGGLLIVGAAAAAGGGGGGGGDDSPSTDPGGVSFSW